MSDGKGISKIYSRIPEDLDKKFGIACINRGLNRPAGLLAAIEMWVAVNLHQPSAYKPANPKAIKPLPDSAGVRQAVKTLEEAIVHLEDVRRVLAEQAHEEEDTDSQLAAIEKAIPRAFKEITGIEQMPGHTAGSVPRHERRIDKRHKGGNLD